LQFACPLVRRQPVLLDYQRQIDTGFLSRLNAAPRRGIPQLVFNSRKTPQESMLEAHSQSQFTATRDP
jgi:hypothetical protein